MDRRTPWESAVMGKSGTALGHPVLCPYCATSFDLFAARWCVHDGEPSKLCPGCQRCVCDHPAYREPDFWKPAPRAFQDRGFQRLFLFYL